jgi:F0F1-type ATP synthase membrane subunit b/b'
MDTILNIFISLGVQKIVGIQFLTVVVFYFILTKLFFSKLQFVIETREGKTTKREGNANKMLNEAEALSLQYKKTIEDTQAQTFADASKKKNILLEEQRSALKQKANQLEEEMTKQRQVNLKEIESQKAIVMNQAEELSKQLLEKISK